MLRSLPGFIPLFDVILLLPSGYPARYFSPHNPITEYSPNGLYLAIAYPTVWGECIYISNNYLIILRRNDESEPA
jgi:hypothetical protein